MKITFVLPAYYNFPIGGYHVHYQYANLLARMGHDVTIVFPRSLTGPDNLKATIETQPLEAINDVFDRLKKGRVNGRVVLQLRAETRKASKPRAA